MAADKPCPHLQPSLIFTYCHGQFSKDHVDMRKRAEILAVASKFWTLQIRSSFPGQLSYGQQI